jgi:hypothetical protein
MNFLRHYSLTRLGSQFRCGRLDAAALTSKRGATDTRAVKALISILILGGVVWLCSFAGVAQTQNAQAPDSGPKSDSSSKAQKNSPTGEGDSKNATSKDATADEDARRAPPISGTWILPDQHDRGVTFQTKLSFFRGHEDNFYVVHEAVECSRGNQSLTSQAEAPIKATKHEITILEGATHEAKDGEITCRASISPGTLHYTISADGQTLMLNVPGEAPMALKRDED